MTETAWLITSGDYSDYAVLAVFTDRALLDAYVELHAAAGETVRVEDVDLNPIADVLRARSLTWCVTMDWDGDNAAAKLTGPVLFSPIEIVRWWHPSPPWNPPLQGRWMSYIVAKDAETAVKAVNERRLIAISEGVPREWNAYFAWLNARNARVSADPATSSLSPDPVSRDTQ